MGCGYSFPLLIAAFFFLLLFMIYYNPNHYHCRCSGYHSDVIFRFNRIKAFPPRAHPAPEYQALQNQLDNLLRDFKLVSRKYSSSEERLEVLKSERY